MYLFFALLRKMYSMNIAWYGIIFLLIACLNSCSNDSNSMLLITTTSTENTGLIDKLVSQFEEKTVYNVKVVAVGTGAALRMGERGDGDVLLVHAPAAEINFVNDGFGISRTQVMKNWFVIVGPSADPAKIKGLSVDEGFKAIAESRSAFVSRGDDSGTHKKEMALWVIAGFQVTPSGEDWYAATGQGMSATLTVALQTQAYTLTDKGTWLATNLDSDQVVLIDQEDELLNVYSVILLNSAAENINHNGARAFRDFMLEAETQNMIEMFGREQYGESLFYRIN
jgi:tungstate transport system substrate-binding protein